MCMLLLLRCKLIRFVLDQSSANSKFSEQFTVNSNFQNIADLFLGGILKMKKQSFEPSVIIPYSKLCELLNAASEVKELQTELKRLERNQAALRYQFIELLEKFRELS